MPSLALLEFIPSAIKEALFVQHNGRTIRESPVAKKDWNIAMSAPTRIDHELPVTTENHLMGFLDSHHDCEELVLAMKHAGMATPVMHTFDGADGLASLHELLKGSWGEAEQAFYERALPELENGHSAICLEVADYDEAARIGKLAGPLGGRNFTHFGVLVDTGIETQGSAPQKG